MSMDDQIAPQAIEAEQSVLGSVLIDPNSIIQVADALSAEDFYRQQHGMIWAAMLSMFTKRIPIDLVTIGDELGESLQVVGGSSYLAGLMSIVPHAARIEHYAAAVSQAARRRRLIAAGSRIVVAAYEEADANDAEQRAMSELLTTMSIGSDQIEVLTPKQQGAELLAMLERRSNGASSGLSTGLRNLDHTIGGFRRGDLIILAGRPGDGKSSCAESIAEAVARDGHFVAFVSVEMNKEQLTFRWASRAGRISSYAFATGQLKEEEWNSLYEIAEARSKLPIYLMDAPGATTQGIRAALTKLELIQQKRIDLVVIDYLQLINDPHQRGQSDASRLEGMTRALKIMARALNTPVMLLSQLNREVEHRTLPEPKLSDLRGSGSIEQDADIVILLWTAENADAAGNYARMKVAKARNGPTAPVAVRFSKPFFRFSDGDYEST